MTRWALYDLRIGPPSFDFLTFLVMAKYHGATAVWVVPGSNDKKLHYYDAAEQDERVRTIVLPACELYGMPCKLESLAGKSPRSYDFAWPPYVMAGKALAPGYMIGWLKSIRAPEPFMPSEQALEKVRARLGNKKIVCHIRTTSYQTVRNSGPGWERWAKDHDAFLLPDDPISLDERLAFHELASLNIGVNAGPMCLSEYSVHRPYITLKKMAGEISTLAEFYARQGWYPGDQLPWAGKHQRLVWNDRDDYETIEAAYQEWLANNPERNSHSGGTQEQDGIEPVLAGEDPHKYAH